MINNKNINTEKLFSYGTLRYEAVQRSTFGRILQGSPDVLCGFKLSQLSIHDPHVRATSGEATHPILIVRDNHTDTIEGMVFDITLEELNLADRYEVADYKRINVTLLSSIRAWVYVSKFSEKR